MIARRSIAPLAVVALVGVVLAAGCSLPGRVSGPVRVFADFEDVNDLVVNHAVQVADVRVGSVTSITLTDDLRHAHVAMDIQDGLELPADSVAVLRQTSLLGEKFIEIRPRRDDDPCQGEPNDGELVDGTVLTCSIQAPELEAVTEEAVQVLGAVLTDDLQTLIETGSVGFGGRGEELRSIVEDLSSVSSTLAAQTGNIVTIIDGLDAAAGTLAAGSADLDGLLINLSQATTVLADNRDEAIAAIESLTRLARAQNQLIFQPHLEATSRQIQELDALLSRLAAGRAEVGNLLDFLFSFVDAVPLSIPCDQVGQEATDAQPNCTSGGDFAQVYGWFVDVASPGRRALMSNKLRIYINLAVFGVVFVVMILWALQNVVSLDSVEDPYDLVVVADAASGVGTNAEVAYLGVHYGRVDGVELVDGGVRLNLKIDREREIPEGSTPRIFRKSPIGEPYIDFQPPEDYDPETAEYFEDGDEVPIRASVPLEFSELLRTASELIGNIEPESARVVIDELAAALEGRGEDLNRLTFATDQLASTFAERTDALDRLAENNTRLTAVLADHRGALGSTITDLSLLAESLRSASGDTAVLLDRGTALLAAAADLIEDARPSIDCLLDDLVPVMDISATPERIAGLETLLQEGPAAFGLFATTIDEEADGPWARVNLEVNLSSPPAQYVPAHELPAVPALVACPGVVAAGSGTSLPSTGFRPSDVLSTTGGGTLPATGAAAAGAIAGVLLLAAVALRRLSQAADG